MKKVKIMLMAITVLALAGGALAFKAQKFNAPDLCCYTTLTADISVPPPITNFPCREEIPNYTTNTLLGEGLPFTAYCTTEPLEGCETVTNCSTIVKSLQ